HDSLLVRKSYPHDALVAASSPADKRDHAFEDPGPSGLVLVAHLAVREPLVGKHQLGSATPFDELHRDQGLGPRVLIRRFPGPRAAPPFGAPPRKAPPRRRPPPRRASGTRPGKARRSASRSRRTPPKPRRPATSTPRPAPGRSRRGTPALSVPHRSAAARRGG